MMETLGFCYEEQPRCLEHAGPWTWIQIRMCGGATVRTVFLPQPVRLAVFSIWAALGSIRRAGNRSDDRNLAGPNLRITSLAWPLCVEVACYRDDQEGFLANLSARKVLP